MEASTAEGGATAVVDFGGAAASSMEASLVEGSASTVEGFRRAATSSMEASTAEGGATAVVDFGGAAASSMEASSVEGGASSVEGGASAVEGFGWAAVSSKEASTAEDVATAMVEFGGGKGRRHGAGPWSGDCYPGSHGGLGCVKRINYVCKRAQRSGSNYAVNLWQYLVHNKNTKVKVKP
eukprot:scaffold60700_cov73-Cyclotella_meneghiniana.AAC.2